MTFGSFIFGSLCFGVAYLCLVAFERKRKRRGTIASAIRSFLSALRRRPTDLPELARAAAPWLCLALLLVLFGVVRQFNLQVHLTEAAQRTAFEEGWYEERSRSQLRIVGSTLALALGAVLALGLLLRRRLADVGLPVFALVLLVALLAVRTVSHHGVDEILGAPVLGFRVANLIELAALAAIALSAALSLRRARAPVRPLIARIESVEPPR